MTSGGDHWRPVQTCSLEDTRGATSGGGGRYASCWNDNAFLSFMFDTQFILKLCFWYVDYLDVLV